MSKKTWRERSIAGIDRLSQGVEWRATLLSASRTSIHFTPITCLGVVLTPIAG